MNEDTSPNRIAAFVKNRLGLVPGILIAVAAACLCRCGDDKSKPSGIVDTIEPLFGSRLTIKYGKAKPVTRIEVDELENRLAPFESAYRLSKGALLSEDAPPDPALGDFFPRIEDLEALLPEFVERTSSDLIHDSARGYAVDMAAAHLKDRGADDFLLELGGTAYAAGSRRTGSSWRVSIPSGGSATGRLCSIPLRDRAIAMAVAYDQNPAVDRSGASIRSVVIAAPSAMAAESLAGYFLSLGPEAWAWTLEGIPGFDALFVTGDGFIVATEEIYGDITLEDERYEVIRFRD